MSAYMQLILLAGLLLSAGIAFALLKWLVGVGCTVLAMFVALEQEDDLWP